MRFLTCFFFFKEGVGYFSFIREEVVIMNVRVVMQTDTYSFGVEYLYVVFSKVIIHLISIYVRYIMGAVQKNTVKLLNP